MEDSVFEQRTTTPEEAGVSPAILREMVLRTLLAVLAAHLAVLVAMVGAALFCEDIRYFLTTYRLLAYLAL